MARTGCYPGSFNPLTVAHLAIAERAVDRYHLDRLDLVVSRVALGKETVDRPRLVDRLAVLQAAADHRSWLGVVVTDSQLLADIAAGYDVLVLGADKWAQVVDPVYYGSETARDLAVARLPQLAIVPRPPFEVPEAHLFHVDKAWHAVSSTAAREGRSEWMAPEAVAFDCATGAWTDPARYEAWLREAGE